MSVTDVAGHRLVVRRTIRASPERLFSAWTSPDQLRAWWGPKGVQCTLAEVDACVGGRYRIGNLLPDGREVFISGEFLEVVPPERLAYTWSTDGSPSRETVTVCFRAVGNVTEVVVVHERIADAQLAEQHRQGWLGCLDGLLDLLH